MISAMLLFGVASAPAPAPTAKELFGAAIRAHRELPAASISLTTSSTMGQKMTYRYQISFVRPSWAKLRVLEPQQGPYAASDRTYAVLGPKLVAYDATANEKLSRSSGNGKTLLSRFESFLGDLDEPVRAALEPDMMELLLLRFTILDGWTVLPKPGAFTATRKVGGEKWSKATWKFDAKTHLVLSTVLEQPAGKLTWEFAYTTAPKTVTLSPPAAALDVDAFTTRPEIPSGTKAPVRAILQKAMHAFTKLRNAKWTAMEGMRKAEAWICGNMIRERQPSAEWSYDGKTLTLFIKGRNKYYRGICRFGEIPKVLGTVGVDMDASSWQYVSRKSPVYTLLASNAKVKKVGETKLDGAVCDLLQIDAPGSKGMLTIRRTDGLVAATGFARVSAKGGPVSNSQRVVHFEGIGKTLPASTFKLSFPAGVSISSFPLAKK